MGRSVRGLPLAPPPDELVERAMEVAASSGLQARFTTHVGPDGILIWVIKIETDRGDLIRWPGDDAGLPMQSGNYVIRDEDWLSLLHELGLIQG
jgi:hypothetical protein